MNGLLDTNALLWFFFEDPRLPESVKDAIASPDNRMFVSVVSAWEIGIKKGLGRLSVPDGMQQEIHRCGFATLPLTFDHAEAVARLPHHHRDPFDRMLIVQARMEGMTLVTADPWFKTYDVELLFMD